jgi:hypothetical protein
MQVYTGQLFHCGVSSYLRVLDWMESGSIELLRIGTFDSRLGNPVAVLAEVFAVCLACHHTTMVPK